MKRGREDRETTMENQGDDKGKRILQSSITSYNSELSTKNYHYKDKDNKRKFMQKYHHIGPFFQSDPDDPGGTAGTDDIYRRDYSGPTGEDKMDKTILPKVMQVRNFGRRGRTKWTHLSNEDTTDRSSPWSYQKLLSQKYNAKMAVMDKPISRPKGNKKLKDWDL